MRVWLQSKPAVVMGLFGVAVVVFCGSLHAQQQGTDFRNWASTGSTVSVASLRIPDKAWRHYDKAKALVEHNRLAESDLESAKAIAIAPDFAAAYLLRATAQIQEHNFDAAIASIAEARRVEPNAPWSGILLSSALNGLRRYDQAVVVLDGLHGAESGSWQAAYEHSRAATGLKDVKAALLWSATALATAPESFADVSILRANALILAHRWGEAASHLENYLQAKTPQVHRAEVLAALESVKKRTREEDLQQVASR